MRRHCVRLCEDADKYKKMRREHKNRDNLKGKTSNDIIDCGAGTLLVLEDPIMRRLSDDDVRAIYFRCSHSSLLIVCTA